MRKIFIAFLALLLLIPLVNGCGNKAGTDTSAPPDQDESMNGDSLDAKIEEMMAEEREPGKVIVGLQNGVTVEEAYSLFSAHGFSVESVGKMEDVPQAYVLSFSEEEREMKYVLKEFIIDSKVEYVQPYYHSYWSVKENNSN